MLQFQEQDKQCNKYLLLKRQALDYKHQIEQRLKGGPSRATHARRGPDNVTNDDDEVACSAFEVIASAHSAIAHSAIVPMDRDGKPSRKFEFLRLRLIDMTEQLSAVVAESCGIGGVEAATGGGGALCKITIAMVDSLRYVLKDFLLNSF